MGTTSRPGPGSWVVLGLLLGLLCAAATPAAAHATEPGVEVETLSQNTVGGVDYVISRITIDPGAATGWHYHVGEVFGFIKDGTMTHYGAGCAVDGIYPAGAPVKEGVGPGFVHNGRNEGATPLVMEVTYINPAGSPLSVGVPAPEACPVS